MASRRQRDPDQQQSSRHDSFTHYDSSASSTASSSVNIPTGITKTTHSSSQEHRAALHPDSARSDSVRSAHHHHHHRDHDRRSRSRSTKPLRKSWPPKPTVEDEEASLAREFGTSKARLECKADDVEVQSRGTVDQEPVIQEVPEFQNQHERRFVRVSGSDSEKTKATGGMPTPPTSEDERMRRGKRKPLKVQADLGDSSPELNRRAASPYAFTKPSQFQREASSKETVMSPEAMTPPVASKASQAFSYPGTPRRPEGPVSPSQRRGNDYFSVPSTAAPPPMAASTARSSLDLPSRNASTSSAASHSTPNSKANSPNPSPRSSVVDYAPAPANAPSPRRISIGSRRYTDTANVLSAPRFDKAKRPTPLSTASAVDDVNGPAVYSASTTPTTGYPLVRPRQTSSHSTRNVSPANPSSQLGPSPQRSPKLGYDINHEQFSTSATSSRPLSREGSYTAVSAGETPKFPQSDLDWNNLLSTNAARRSRQHPSRLSASVRVESAPNSPGGRSIIGSPTTRVPVALPYPIDDGPPSVFMPSEETHAYHPKNPTSLEAHAAHEFRSAPLLSPVATAAGASALTAALHPKRPPLATRHSMAGVSSNETRPSPTESRWPPEARTLTPEVKKEIAAMFKKGLPHCSRPAPVAGKDDWYTIIGAPSLDFCPDCIDDIFERSIYRAAFRRSPPRNFDTKVQCAFGSPWIRLAWLLTLERQRTDLMLLRDIADVDHSSEPCPGGKADSRSWYGLRDQDGYFVSGFHICYSDVRKIERLLPTLSGLFVRLPSHLSSEQKLCAMRGDANRFPTYMNALISMHEKAQEARRLPDQVPLIKLVQRKTRLRECSKDNMLLGGQWHYISAIPTFVVCEDCFESVVEPEVRKNKEMAMRFNRSPQRVAYDEVMGSSCQLYSSRMRQIFKQCVEEGDLKYLARKARERRDAEVRLQERYADVMRRARRLAVAPNAIAGEEERRLDRELEIISAEWKERWE